MIEITRQDREAADAIYRALLARIKGEEGGHSIAEMAAQIRIAAYAAGKDEERERCAAAAQSVQQEQLTKSLNTPAKNSSMIHARNGALAAATKILKAIRSET